MQSVRIHSIDLLRALITLLVVIVLGLTIGGCRKGEHVVLDGLGGEQVILEDLRITDRIGTPDLPAGDDLNSVNDTSQSTEPGISLVISRLNGATEYPPALAVATITDQFGKPWEGDVTAVVASPTASFEPTAGELEALGDGRYQIAVFAARSGEVEVTIQAKVDGVALAAATTILFLPYVAPEWDIPVAVASVNTNGYEDSAAISPDGRTLFFSYTPLVGCGYLPAGYGDEPDKPECANPAGPVGPPERECTFGLTADGAVSPGLFGDTDQWPWVKSLMSTYVATRKKDGTFDYPKWISFDDDGTLLEVSPSSGSENPAPGEEYNFFFGYPDWLDLDPEFNNTIYAVATISAGQSVVLSDPITQMSNPPVKVLARTLTGEMNVVREQSAQIGEYKVFWNPVSNQHELWFERRVTDEGSLDIVVSPLLGDYPDGDWGAAVPIPGLVNTDSHEEGFPAPAMMPGPDGDELHMFFNRGIPDETGGEAHILEARFEDGAWTDGTPVISASGSDAGAVFIVALPALSRGDFGTEMFFVYVLIYPDHLDFQIGRMKLVN
jgi:hypothetical protein